MTDQAKEKQQTEVPRVNIPSAKRNNHNWVRGKLRDAALRCMYTNRGCALSVGGPGERMSITGVDQHLVRDFGTIFEKQNDGNCITAAIANAIDVVCGREVGKAIKEYFFEENPHYLKIRKATLLLRELVTGAEMRLLPKKDRKAFNANRFAYLANRESGVYVVHVFQHAVVSHTVVIDANRKLIIGSAEDYPMRLSEELLRKCGRDRAERLRVGEVRLIVSQSESRNDH